MIDCSLCPKMIKYLSLPNPKYFYHRSWVYMCGESIRLCLQKRRERIMFIRKFEKERCPFNIMKEEGQKEIVEYAI